MAYKKLAVLTYNLYKSTLSGRIDWEETALHDVYQASLADYSLTICLRGANVRIAIANETGTEIEAFEDVDLIKEWFGELNVSDGPYEIMKRIYVLARRRALGSERVIDDILKELDDEDLPT